MARYRCPYCDSREKPRAPAPTISRTLVMIATLLLVVSSCGLLFPLLWVVKPSEDKYCPECGNFVSK